MVGAVRWREGEVGGGGGGGGGGEFEYNYYCTGISTFESLLLNTSIKGSPTVVNLCSSHLSLFTGHLYRGDTSPCTRGFHGINSKEAVCPTGVVRLRT